MSQVSSQALVKGILGACAVSLTFGAVQLASGRDLGSAPQAPVSQASLSSFAGAATVNREAKADRAAGLSASGERAQTISLRLDHLSDMSVLVRVPVARATRENSLAKPIDRKVACEPVVSVLTDVAKLLEPGRCVT